MNFNKSLWKNLGYSEEEISVLIREQAACPTLIEALGKLIQYQQKNIERESWDFDNPNYAYKRAFLDGKMCELTKLYEVVMTPQPQQQERRRRSNEYGQWDDHPR